VLSRTRFWRALVLTLIVGLVAAASATALLRGPALWKPWKAGSSGVTGKAYVGGDCGGYITCSFHTSLERSSWSGYRTLDGSIIRNRLGYQWPRGTRLWGTYTYKTHFHANISQFGQCGLQWCIRYGTVTADSDGARLSR
jgi:hypothetical protein